MKKKTAEDYAYEDFLEGLERGKKNLLIPEKKSKSG